MNNVFGELLVSVLLPVKSKTEDLALLEANYKISPDRFVKMELIGVTGNGEEVRIPVMEILKTKLDEFVGE